MEHENIHNPLVSIVIPLFNSEQFIAETIQSAVNQTYKQIEIIIVNDGSTDSSINIVSQFTDVRIIHQNNKGTGNARNTGVRFSNGKYIAFLDADDKWHSHKIQEQIKVFSRYPNVVVVTTEKEVIDEKSIPIPSRNKKGIPYDKPFYPYDILLNSGNCFCLSSSMIRKESFLSIGGFCDTLSEDYDLWIRLASKGGSFYIISKKLTYYRILEKSRSHGNLQKEFGAQLKVISLHRAKYHPRQLLKRKAKVFYEWADSAFFINDMSVWRAVWISVKYNPINIKIYYLLLRCLIKKIRQKLKELS